MHGYFFIVVNLLIWLAYVYCVFLWLVLVVLVLLSQY